jgi:toxin ParE1/3/4
MRSAQSLTFHVEILPHAERDLRHIYAYIHAQSSQRARAWFKGLGAAIASLDQRPARGSLIPENGHLHQLLYGKRPHVYRIIYLIDQRQRVVVHIRHGARDRLRPTSD